MDIHFDRETQDLWAICDDGCEGQSAVLRIDPVTHKFAVVCVFARPATKPNINNAIRTGRLPTALPSVPPTWRALGVSAEGSVPTIIRSDTDRKECGR
jgi:hypothetical protein